MRLVIAVFSILFLLGGYVYAIDPTESVCDGATIIDIRKSQEYHGEGTEGDDFFCNPGGKNWDSTRTIKLYGGDDTYYGADKPRGALEIVYGGAGDDELHGEGGANEIHGEDGDDGVYGGGRDDRLFGGDGNDNIYSAWGKDVLYGGKGNDNLDGGPGKDTLYGGGGKDIFLVGAFRKNDRIMDFSIEDDLLVFVGHRMIKTSSYHYLNPRGYYWDLIPAAERYNLQKPKLTAKKGYILLWGERVVSIYEDGKRSQELAEKIISEERFQMCGDRSEATRTWGDYPIYPERTGISADKTGLCRWLFTRPAVIFD